MYGLQRTEEKRLQIVLTFGKKKRFITQINCQEELGGHLVAYL